MANLEDDTDAALTPMRTRDVDFQVDLSSSNYNHIAAIETFARAVGGRVVRPAIDDHTPELAQVIIPDYFGSDDPLIVDFLLDVLGLSPQEVAEHAEILEADATDGQPIEFRIAHPVHVLFSAVENFIRLPARRSPGTLIRIDRLIPVVRQYICRVATESVRHKDPKTALHLEKDARWSMQMLLRRSETQQYASFTLNTERDLLDAMPSKDEAPVNPSFWDEEYPRLRAKVEKRRIAVSRRNQGR